MTTKNQDHVAAAEKPEAKEATHPETTHAADQKIGSVEDKDHHDPHVDGKPEVSLDDMHVAHTKDTIHKDAQAGIDPTKTAAESGVDMDKATGLVPGASVPTGHGDVGGVAKAPTDQGSGNNPVIIEGGPPLGIDTAG